MQGAGTVTAKPLQPLPVQAATAAVDELADFGPKFWTHLLLAIAPLYLAALLFDWKLILLGVVGRIWMHFQCGGCPMTKDQFGSADHCFHGIYIRKIPGMSWVTDHHARIWQNWIVTPGVVFWAIFRQIYHGHAALIGFPPFDLNFWRHLL